jgi:hypothetical protein
MKTLFVLFILILNLWSDTLPPEGYHYVSRKTYITNVSQYSNYVLIGYADLLTGDYPKPYLIENDVALYKGYKFNTLYIYAMSRELFDAHGGLEGIDLEGLSKKSQYSPFPSDIYIVDDNCSVLQDDYYYDIESIDDANIVFKLQQRIITDKEGETKVIHY